MLFFVIFMKFSTKKTAMLNIAFYNIFLYFIAHCTIFQELKFIFPR